MQGPSSDLLKRFIWPRYREKGPPSYIDSIFFDKECFDNEGRIKNPIKSILDITVLGYRPVTTLSILELLVENRNRPMYGAQIGKEIEGKFHLPKGWFTKTRYYDTRIGKLLQILCRLDILKETEIKDSITKRHYIGYRISDNIYTSVRDKMLGFVQEGTLSVFVPTKSTQESIQTRETKPVRRCRKCQTLTTSSQARYCELCGDALNTVCQKCTRENSLEYLYCLHCGERLG